MDVLILLVHDLWAGVGGRGLGAPAVGAWSLGPMPARVPRARARKLCLNLLPKLGGGDRKPNWGTVGVMGKTRSREGHGVMGERLCGCQGRICSGCQLSTAVEVGAQV